MEHSSLLNFILRCKTDWGFQALASFFHLYLFYTSLNSNTKVTVLTTVKQQKVTHILSHRILGANFKNKILNVIKS